MIQNKLSPATALLKDGKHLLAFSGGVDSVALFFILLELNVCFDIAIVHYHTRKQADDEVAYAKQLAKTYHKQCFLAHAPHFSSHFERQAREFRFAFFDTLIKEHSYQSLVLAHQLNDRFEWMMMQLTRGSGLGNLLGFEDSRTYPIIRPLELLPKNALYRFCKKRDLLYFEDESNQNTHFRRNYFRHHFCTQLIEQFSDGIARSMIYLKQDRDYLASLLKPKIWNLRALEEHILDSISTHDSACVQSICAIYAFHFSAAHSTSHIATQDGEAETTYIAINACDKIAKTCGYVLSSAQREAIIKSGFSCKIHELIIAKNQESLFIATDILSMYKIVTQKPIAKKFKTLCAAYKIPPKLRFLLWGEFCLANETTHLTHNKMTKEVMEAKIAKKYDIFSEKMKHFFYF